MNNTAETSAAFFIGFGIMLIIAIGLTTPKNRARMTECNLRFELVQTDSARLATVREYSYCLEHLPEITP